MIVSYGEIGPLFHYLVVSQSSMICTRHTQEFQESRIKALARNCVWWPNLDADLEAKVQGCSECQEYQKSPSKAPLHPWDWPDSFWFRLHINFAGPCLGGKIFLVLVDAHSKWLEIMESKTTSEAAICCLQSVFATHGPPENIVSDNVPTFTSELFAAYLSQNGIHHNKSAPPTTLP